jgi:sirohydrochlorin cobaltochelatase
VESLKTLILLAHGSRAPETFEEMRKLAENLQARHSGTRVQSAFLGMLQPDLPSAISEATSAGAQEIRVLPLFFFSGKHVQEDIPRLVAQAQASHPGIRIELLEAAGRHPDFPEFVARAGGLLAL